jgi:hypothetical protein
MIILPFIREVPQPIGIATAHTTAMASQSSGGGS